ncbi:hypothetical protein J6P92_07945 [bacterium]|nr:hypothetical protein [bacterium]
MIIRKIENRQYTPISYGRNKLFRETIPEPIKHNNAIYIMKNAKIHYLDKYMFRTLDYISPLINKYPKIGNKIVNIFEKLIRFNNKLA